MAQKQKIFHIITESLGILIGVYLISISSKVPEEYSTPLLLIGIGTLVIDGLFLTTWR